MGSLKRVLDRLGLKQTDFAKLIDVSPRTVSLWATGEVTIPGPVRAYLRMLQFADRSRRDLEYGRLESQSSVIKEGLYSLRYGAAGANQATGSRGDAVALLKGGRIVGSDLWGGKFKGCYQFDRARQTHHVRVWFRAPPSGELITGRSVGETGALVEVVAELDLPDPFASAVAHVDGRRMDLTLAYLGPLSVD